MMRPAGDQTENMVQFRFGENPLGLFGATCILVK